MVSAVFVIGTLSVKLLTLSDSSVAILVRIFVRLVIAIGLKLKQI